MKQEYWSLDTPGWRHRYKSIHALKVSRCDVHGDMETETLGAIFDNSESEYSSIQVCLACLETLVFALKARV